MDDAEVREFIGEYRMTHTLLDTDKPVTYGAMTLPDTYIVFKHQQSQAMARAKDVVSEVRSEFGRKFGREYGVLECYRLEDAETAIVILNSAAGTTKVVVDELRKAEDNKPRIRAGWKRL